MDILQAIILGIVQGATEFIPVSSSAHLILVPWMLGWDLPSLAFDIVLHLGTLVAVLVYFRNEWLDMARSTVQWVTTRKVDGNLRLLGLLIVGTIPAAVIGGLFKDELESLFSHPLLASGMLLVTAAVLVISERAGKGVKSLQDIAWLDSLLVGLAQAVAIVPGISRSGSTIAAGRMRDFTREGAARFSFLLATPIIAGVGFVQLFDLANEGIAASEFGLMVVGFISSLVSGYVAIWWLLGFLRSRSTLVFAIYCIVVGATGIAVALIRAS